MLCSNVTEINKKNLDNEETKIIAYPKYSLYGYMVANDCCLLILTDRWRAVIRRAIRAPYRQ
jgi:hypothetical protein